MQMERPLAKYMHSPFQEASIRLNVETIRIDN
jgi:hypothetical protein